MNFGQVNPNLAFAGFILLIVAAAVGEYFKVVLPGTASVLLGGLTGGGIYHIASAQASKIAIQQTGDTSNGSSKSQLP